MWRSCSPIAASQPNPPLARRSRPRCASWTPSARFSMPRSARRSWPWLRAQRPPLCPADATMNNPVTGHQALVAAFMSALVRQELIALLILVGLTAFWMVLREWRPDLARPRRGPAVRTGVADPGHGEPSARRLLRIGFGALWLFDGVLQVQPGIPSGLPTRVIIPAAATSPHWVRTLAGWAASAWTHHPVQASTSVVWIQLGIGIWLLTTPH